MRVKSCCLDAGWGRLHRIDLIAIAGALRGIDAQPGRVAAACSRRNSSWDDGFKWAAGLFCSLGRGQMRFPREVLI